jgi:hypothetical protein
VWIGHERRYHRAPLPRRSRLEVDRLERCSRNSEPTARELDAIATATVPSPGSLSEPATTRTRVAQRGRVTVCRPQRGTSGAVGKMAGGSRQSASIAPQGSRSTTCRASPPTADVRAELGPPRPPRKGGVMAALARRSGRRVPPAGGTARASERQPASGSRRLRESASRTSRTPPQRSARRRSTRSSRAAAAGCASAYSPPSSRVISGEPSG